MANEVAFEKRGHIALVTLNRPEARNALNLAALAALADAWVDAKGILFSTNDDVGNRTQCL